ncbi:recombinase family protein [Nonomuraea fuscirosea]|uniref:recombinase family protein n=1 Tax=Nonomuraea fuscirosea TaxID=1291556 RepID=UPI003899DB0C
MPSGKIDRRPELDKALDYLRPGDTFVITRLSRAARSLRHLLDLAAQLRGREVDLLVLKQGIDTSTPSGRLQFHMFGAFDEFLRELIVEGTWKGSPRPERAAASAGAHRPWTPTAWRWLARCTR